MIKIRNRYRLLKIKLFFVACLNGKISLRKLWNVLYCSLAYKFKKSKSGDVPFILSLELGNDCNANCLFCRDAKGGIYDINTKHPSPHGIPKGRMPLEMAIDIIGQIKEDVLIAVLYTNGEPMLYADIVEVIRFCSRNKVMSMIATNGILLNEKKANEILAAGLDFLKVQLSGFTQDIYSIQVRYGDVERIKDNIRSFVEIRNSRKQNTVIMLDYILYKYNLHQLPLIREFCRDLGIILNIRPGNPKGGLEDKEPLQSTEELPLKMSCAWLWKGMQINFNGDVLPCCDGVIFSGIIPYEVYRVGQSNVRKIWNGKAALEMRRTITVHGRGSIPICAQCYRKDIVFKW